MESSSISDLIRNSSYTTKTLNCRGCDNNCLVVRYDFGDGKVYHSGNRCERIFTNGSKALSKGANAYDEKLRILLSQEHTKMPLNPILTIGIPRVLNMFEDFPFWNALLSSAGFKVVLSAPSDMRSYEANARMVMSDNICFPAKLVHAHVANLEKAGVDRIFFPFVTFGPAGKDQNSYNCPIVAGYSQVIRNCGPVSVPFDSPVFSMKDNRLFRKACIQYLTSIGANRKTAAEAFETALLERSKAESELVECNRKILESKDRKAMTILLAGRPYHTDPLIQHKVADMIASLGVDVITDDIVRFESMDLKDANFLSQWTYTNRILKAAKWCGEQGRNVQFVEFTSFGCGPDAFLTGAVRDLLSRYGKSLTLLKLDDISNAGSMKLRVRSLIDSLKLAAGAEGPDTPAAPKPFLTTPPFLEKDRTRTILVPFFTPFISPLIRPILSQLDYDVISLPPSTQMTADIGLKYANNEVCYPATLVVGDLITALQSGKYDLNNTAVAMTQTGGQCRASNYLGLIKKGLIDAGFGNIPVISVAFGGDLGNYQPGFKVNWLKALPLAIDAVLFSDCMEKLYYPAAVRQKPGCDALKLKDEFMERAIDLIGSGKHVELQSLAGEAAKAFDDISDDSAHTKVGIVGEIYLKFNPFAHKNLMNWLMDRNIEVVPPILTAFFTQFFVNRIVNKKNLVEKSSIPDWLMDKAYSLLKNVQKKYEKACSAYRYFTPFEDVFDISRTASESIELGVQFGEGWLLPGEVGQYYKQGVHNVLSLQPFGCIANHIIARGVEKKLKEIYPDLNLLALDFDSGVSETNITNRMLLFIDRLR